MMYTNLKTKLNTKASSFLSDKMSYQLSLVSIDSIFKFYKIEEIVEPLVFDGYVVRTVD